MESQFNIQLSSNDLANVLQTPDAGSAIVKNFLTNMRKHNVAYPALFDSDALRKFLNTVCHRTLVTTAMYFAKGAKPQHFRADSDQHIAKLNFINSILHRLANNASRLADSVDRLEATRQKVEGWIRIECNVVPHPVSQLLEHANTSGMRLTVVDRLSSIGDMVFAISF